MMKHTKILLIVLFSALSSIVNAQSLSVFLQDNSGSQTNVRNAPKGKVVAKLNDKHDIMFDVEAPQNGWWRIADGLYIDPDNDMEEFELKGSTTGYWVHYSVIGTATRNYGGQTLHLRQAPSEKARAVYTFKKEIVVRPLEIRGKWVKVVTEDGKHTGWIDTFWLCGNSVTNCC